MTGDQHPLDISKNPTQQLAVDVALAAAGLGVWQYDPATGEANWDERCRALFGISEGHSISVEQALRHIHPDDIVLVSAVVASAQAPSSDGRCEVTFRTIGRDDGLVRWVRFTGKAEFTDTGQAVRFAGVGQAVPEPVPVQQASTEREAQLTAIIDESPVAICLFVGPDMVVQRHNRVFVEVLGKGPDLLGKPLRDVMPEIQDQPFLDLLANVYTSGQPFRSDSVPATIIRDGVAHTGFFNLNYVPLLNETGQSYAILGIAVDVTGEALARRQLAHQRAQLEGVIQQTPAPTLVLRGDDYRIDQINPPMLAFMGRGNEVIGQPLLAIMPELADQFAWQQVQRVYQEGLDFDQADVPILHLRNGVMQTTYYNISYRPLREAGQVTGMIQVAIDVTEQVLARQQLEESEAKLRSLIAAAPAGIGLFVGRDLIIENPNQTFIDIVGKGPSIEGLPLREAMPELLTEGQPFLTILDDVFTTGVPFLSPASPVRIVQNGVLNDNYYNIAYVPIRNAASEIYAILDIAIDVTAQVRAEQALRESQSALQSVIDLAEVGSYHIDLATNQLTKSARLADWYGLPTHTSVAASLGAVEENDRERISRVFTDTLLPGSSGAYQIDYTVVSQQTGQHRVVRATGQVLWDSAGQPVSIYGSVLDITTQRAVQLALEQQVQQRTEEIALNNEELAATNEELAASNEEYAVINEELEEANELLNRSNANLQTFAYIASHDLQEPLRKIQQFGDLLKTRLTGLAGEDEMAYLERMQVAASRMSTLIRDLLSYSRISTQRNADDAVSLDEVLRDVLGVLDLAIIETQAEVQFDALPVVSGDAAQLGQLFQNLLSNALKFRRADVVPRIRISSQTVPIDQIPPAIKPVRRTPAYHCIEVADNGIGFDEKYLDRIFQVFQRLHSKSQYAGTGVGLAICEKVVISHGGALTATSQLGQGATFVIYLPVTL